jgi:hypothetical protein
MPLLRAENRATFEQSPEVDGVTDSAGLPDLGLLNA